MGYLTAAFVLLVVGQKPAQNKDPFAVLRPFHPVERFFKEQSQPLVSRTPSGGMSKRYSYRWIRTFKFPKETKALLTTLRKMDHINGTTYDAVGKYMTVKFPNGREGTYDYRTKTLIFDEPAPRR